MKKRQFTHITQKDFDSIKMLQKAGLNANQASRATKRTHRVVSAIYKSETLEQYRLVSAKRKQPEQLAATDTISEVIRQAKIDGAIVLTTHAAFIGFDDLYEFIKEASDNDVTVTFAPMSK